MRTGEFAGSLLGDGHRACVGQLVALYEDLGASGPRMVLMVGPSGTGKTRIIQEFYREIALLQSAPRYWPENLVDSDSASREPLLARKVVTPDTQDFEWPAGALPSFTWWALACERLQDGSLRDPRHDVGDQLHAHTLAAQMALAQSSSGVGAFSERLPAIRKRAQEALQEGGLELAGQILGDAGLPVPGLGLFVKWMGASAAHVRSRREHLGRLQSAIDIGSEIRAEAQERSYALGELLTSLTGPRLPGVLVVEDLHVAPPSVLDTIDAILRNPAANILIVANAWPESLVESEAGSRLGHWQELGRLEQHDVPEMMFEDLAALAACFAPNTDRFSIEWLAATHPNPLAMSMFLTLPSTRAQVEQASGAFRAPVGATRTPRAVSDLYRARWLELPEAARRALTFAYAVGCLEPESVGAFLPSTVIDGAQRAGLLDSAAVPAARRSLWQASVDFGWLKRAPEHWAFAEVALVQATAEGLDEFLTPEAVDRLRNGVGEVLRESVSWSLDAMGRRWSSFGGEPPSGLFVQGPRHERDTDALLALTATEMWGSVDLCVPLLTRIAALARNGDAAGALELIRRYDPLRHIPEGWDLRLELEREVSEWLIGQGDLQSAFTLMESVVNRREASGFRGVDASMLYAELLGLLGRPEEAWQEFEWMAEWTDYDVRIEGISWLIEARGHDAAWEFLVTLLGAAERGEAESWIGVECARLLRSRSLRLGNDDSAAHFLIRAILLCGDDVENDLLQAYSALPTDLRSPLADLKVEFDDLMVSSSTASTRVSEPVEPDVKPLYELWSLDKLDEEGRYDEAVPYAEQMLEALSETDREGRTYTALRLWMAHLYMEAGLPRESAQTLLGFLSENGPTSEHHDLKVQIREHAYITHHLWGQGERKAKYLRLSTLVGRAWHALGEVPQHASLRDRLRKEAGPLWSHDD